MLAHTFRDTGAGPLLDKAQNFGKRAVRRGEAVLAGGTPRIGQHVVFVAVFVAVSSSGFGVRPWPRALNAGGLPASE